MNYSLRQQRQSKKEIAAMSKWANRPRADQPNEMTEQRRALWDGLNEFLRRNGAAIVSVKYASPIRIEVAPESELPARLRELGYDLMFREQATRIGAAPVEHDRRGRALASAGYGFQVVDVFQLQLPK